MKKLYTIEEIAGEGLMALIGVRVLLMCQNYFYTGKLISVNDSCVKLEDPAIVYQTGDWSAEKYADEQFMHCKTFYIQTHAIEGFGVAK